jgi:hypothetical protein
VFFIKPKVDKVQKYLNYTVTKKKWFYVFFVVIFKKKFGNANGVGREAAVFENPGIIAK